MAAWHDLGAARRPSPQRRRLLARGAIHMVEALHLQVLGGLRITKGEVPVTGFVSSKAPALLCYLAVTARPHFRTELAALFWSEWTETDARTSLRRVLGNL